MNDTLTLALIVSGLVLGVLLFAALMIHVCTYHIRIYKSIKTPVKTMGVIDEVRCVKAEHNGKDHYVVTYSYTDNNGAQRTNSIKRLQNVGKAGDKLALYYDSQSTQNSISELQLKHGKNLWSKVLIILAALTVPAVFCGIYFG